MAEPNVMYSPIVPPINFRNYYPDGWETVLASSWDGSGIPPVSSWIGLDAVLKSVNGSAVYIVVEWIESNKTYRVQFKVWASSGVLNCMRDVDMATDVADFSVAIPAGARVYVSLMGSEIQKIVNFSPIIIPFYIRYGGFASFYPLEYLILNPDGSEYQTPSVPDAQTTGLLLTAYQTNIGYVVIGSQFLTGSKQWFIPPSGSNGVPS
jgi:hypothetical protein